MFAWSTSTLSLEPSKMFLENFQARNGANQFSSARFSQVIS
jgi:hypothetical protein